MSVRPITIDVPINELFGDYESAVCPPFPGSGLYDVDERAYHADCVAKNVLPVTESLADGVLDQRDIDRYERNFVYSQSFRRERIHTIKTLYAIVRRFDVMDAAKFREWFKANGQLLTRRTWQVADVLGHKIGVVEKPGKRDFCTPFDMIAGDSLLIAVHPSSYFDENFSAKSGIDDQVKRAKKNDVPVVYLYNKDSTYTEYYPADVDPDYFISSVDGETYFSTKASEITLVGGYFYNCYSNSIAHLIYYNESDELTVKIPSDAVYVMKSTLKFYLERSEVQVARDFIIDALENVIDIVGKHKLINSLTIIYKGEEIYYRRKFWLFGQSIKVVVD